MEDDIHGSVEWSEYDASPIPGADIIRPRLDRCSGSFGSGAWHSASGEWFQLRGSNTVRLAEEPSGGIA